MGHFVAVVAMKQAIALARQHGSGAVAVRNSNFFGAAGYYVDMAARAGCVGLCFSNSFPKVAAHGGTKPVLGTNPLAMGVPRGEGESLILDMATSAAAGSTVRRAVELGEPLEHLVGLVKATAQHEGTSEGHGLGGFGRRAGGRDLGKG